MVGVSKEETAGHPSRGDKEQQGKGHMPQPHIFERGRVSSRGRTGKGHEL